LRGRAVVGTAITVVVVILFVIPEIAFSFPPGTYSCPANGCGFVKLGSVTYWAFGAGGVLTDHGYTIYLARFPGATGTISSSSSVSYTVTTVVPDQKISSNTTDGLQLVARIVPLITSQPQNITVVAVVNNTLSSSVTVNATSLENPVHGPCSQEFATGVRVYAEHDTFANLSKASELLLFDPSLEYPCVTVQIYQYTFSPRSDIANVTWSSSSSLGTRAVNETSTLTGYWIASEEGGNYSFHLFPRGNYTILVFDAWGQEVLGYFEIV
jgi:hypothetical protein